MWDWLVLLAGVPLLFLAVRSTSSLPLAESLKRNFTDSNFTLQYPRFQADDDDDDRSNGEERSVIGPRHSLFLLDHVLWEVIAGFIFR